MSLVENKQIKQVFALQPLVLASASPRRAEILQAVGWQFERRTAEIDESPQKGETPESYVERLARTKAKAVARQLENRLILGADTTVVLEDEIIGKPKNTDDARQMLHKLSGKWHEVLTGVALFKKTNNEMIYRDAHERTRVKFAELSEQEIEFLIETGEPLDKAGAYAVQAQAALFIERIEGDYWNVVGLPVSKVYRMWIENRVAFK
jgi:septum formation protein